jgi:hypothetical protein
MNAENGVGDSEAEESSGGDDSDDDEHYDEGLDGVVGNWEEGVIEDISSISCLEQCTVNKAIKKCRSLVKMVRKSSILSAFFNHHKIQLKIEVSLMGDCRSRWNSTFRLIKAMILYKPIINRLYAERYHLDLTKKQRTK